MATGDPTNRMLDATLRAAGTLSAQAGNTQNRELRQALLEGSCNVIDAALLRHQQFERLEGRAAGV